MGDVLRDYLIRKDRKVAETVMNVIVKLLNERTQTKCLPRLADMPFLVNSTRGDEKEGKGKREADRSAVMNKRITIRPGLFPPRLGVDYPPSYIVTAVH